MKAARKSGYEHIIAMLHYPPTNDKLEPSLFTEILEKYQVKEVVYGHLHGASSYDAGLKGTHNGVNYHLTSCDYTDFKMVRII